MKSIVITGSTRGIGLGLADAFLSLGLAVTINGRSPASVNRALDHLAGKHGRDRLHGLPASVTCLAELEALWQTAADRFGQVDIWINNAGLGHELTPMWEISPEKIVDILDTNVLGMGYGSRVAIRHMQTQGSGQLYNMMGHGANGRTQPGMTIYGTSKAACHYLTKALIQEAAGLPIQIGSLSPGMVITDLITDRIRENPEAAARTRRVMNILADRVETVTPWLAQKILANYQTGAEIRWLTRPKIIWRFLTAPFRKRDLFTE